MQYLDFVQIIRILLAYTLGAQIVYGFSILILGRVMSDFFAQGIFDPPENLFQKTTNIIMIGMIGSGYYINLKLMKYSWFMRKLLMLVALILQSIASIIIYYIVYESLKAIFY